MAIDYPLAVPSSPSPSRVVWKQVNAIGMSTSPFTYRQQLQQHQGGLWTAEVTLPPMKRADAESWISFLLKLRGRFGYFLMPPWGSLTNRGVSTAIYSNGPIIDHGLANPTGQRSITSRLWTPSTTNILREGDWLEIHNNYLKSFQSFAASDWTKSGTGGAAAPTVTADVSSPLSPTGQMNADQIDFPATTGSQTSKIEQLQTGTADAPFNQFFTARVFLRASASVSINVELYDEDATLATASPSLTNTAWSEVVLTNTSFFSFQIGLRIIQPISQSAKTIFAYGASIDSDEDAHLHKVLNDVSSDSNGNISLDIAPGLNYVNDGARIVPSGMKGLFRLANNQAEWDLASAQIYGLSFSAMEAFNP